MGLHLEAHQVVLVKFNNTGVVAEYRAQERLLVPQILGCFLYVGSIERFDMLLCACLFINIVDVGTEYLMLAVL